VELRKAWGISSCLFSSVVGTKYVTEVDRRLYRIKRPKFPLNTSGMRTLVKNGVKKQEENRNTSTQK
jgi:predicted nuclease with RNAse H fold